MPARESSRYADHDEDHSQEKLDEQRRCAVAKELVKDTERWHSVHGAKETTLEREREREGVGEGGGEVKGERRGDENIRVRQ